MNTDEVKTSESVEVKKVRAKRLPILKDFSPKEFLTDTNLEALIEKLRNLLKK